MVEQCWASFSKPKNAMAAVALSVTSFSKCRRVSTCGSASVSNLGDSQRYVEIPRCSSDETWICESHGPAKRKLKQEQNSGSLQCLMKNMRAAVNNSMSSPAIWSGPYLSPWFCTCEDGGTNLCKERKGIYLWSRANFSTNSLTKLSLWRGPPIRCTMCVVHFPNTKGKKHDLP